MKYINIIVEGSSEEVFVNDVLGNTLHPSIFLFLLVRLKLVGIELITNLLRADY